MSRRITYGELLDAASRDLAGAAQVVATTAFADRRDARGAIGAYRDAAYALGLLTGQVLAPRPQLRAAVRGLPTPPLPAAARMERTLRVLGRPTPWSEDPAPPSTPASALWRSAAVGMRTAHDLLATHWDSDGVAVTPQVVPLGFTESRAAGLLDVAGLARIVADSAAALALRAGRAGIEWASVERLVSCVSSPLKKWRE